MDSVIIDYSTTSLNGVIFTPVYLDLMLVETSITRVANIKYAENSDVCLLLNVILNVIFAHEHSQDILTGRKTMSKSFAMQLCKASNLYWT